ncbi:MAG: hypothetical protein ACO3ZY_06295 [Phycisphaerales bacterium]
MTDLDASGALRTTRGGTTLAVADGVMPDAEVAKWKSTLPAEG